ncbi:hypothetical protein Bca52824_085763 [Brassica carinata]|uniref:RNase H type-1 domain-containing protein n=1 Tax=Brassica carinata TaxID=52824 RepID=A0A8X7TL69_BRACI|nr:hypothetical protein Bca52824_085763 [Brassica carinata]
MEEVEASVRVKGATKENHAVLGGWILCEFDMDWSKRHDTMGAAWILKDENGRVLEHSRRAFSDVKTVGEAKLQMWLWVMESMKSLRKKKVRFVSTFGDYRELQGFEAWELRIGSPVTVRCASLIAQSVMSLGLTQSCVAVGHPRWLDHLYASERNSSDG